MVRLMVLINFIRAIDIKKNRLLEVCYVPATSATSSKAFVSFFTLRPFIVLTRQTRQALHAIKQSISLDVNN
jgi:hypothetical protein